MKAFMLIPVFIFLSYCEANVQKTSQEKIIMESVTQDFHDETELNYQGMNVRSQALIHVELVNYLN